MATEHIVAMNIDPTFFQASVAAAPSQEGDMSLDTATSFQAAANFQTALTLEVKPEDVHVEVNPDLIHQCEGAVLLSQIEPQMPQNDSLLGGFFSVCQEFSNDIRELSASINQGQPASVGPTEIAADFEPATQYTQTLTMKNSMMG
ncbi:MAG: hypothetical protein HRT94_04635 [Alphaproteobacteria bacterium]|nr:hypothetical protein [Alphaproteobacteria bacterium]